MSVQKNLNQNKGYYYSVTDDEIKAHLARSCKDIFQWIETTNRFVYQAQTPQERFRTKASKFV